MNKTIVVILAAGLAACGSPALKPVRTDIPTAPTPAPDFALQDLSGATIRLADLRGKTVLLDFWATWCEPCKESIPRYIKMQEKLRPKGFVVVGIDEDENGEIATAYARDHGLNYTVLLDPGTGLFEKYGGRSLPSAFLIDAKGNIRGRWEGFDAATGVDVERATYFLMGAPVKF
jgi:peroxiredoxin